MKCDEGSDAWNSLRISHIHVFLKKFWPTCTAKDKHGVRERSAKEKKIGEDGVFQMKEFRTTLACFQEEED